MKMKFTLSFNFKSYLFQKAKDFFREMGRDDLALLPEKQFGYTFIFYDESEVTIFLDSAKRHGFDINKII
jgi:hypothetical protein